MCLSPLERNRIVRFPRAGNSIKQLFSLEIAGLQAGFGDVPSPWTPEELRGPALVSHCPWAESSLPGMTQGLCELQFGIFQLHSPSPPLLCLWPCPCLPSARGSGFSWLCQTTRPWCLLPVPGCQCLVLCQCQGGEHVLGLGGSAPARIPTHSKPPLHSCLLWGAEGQQIIVPCCSSLMCVLVSYNYVAILVYLF